MKIKGERLGAPKPQAISIDRGDVKVMFVAQFVSSDDFEQQYPRPVIPTKMYPDGRSELLRDDPEYVKKLEDWAEKKTQWTILKSLEATPDLEWETVDINNSETWANHEQELKEAGFSEFHLAKIFNLVMAVNGLSSSMVEDATEAFLTGQLAPAPSQ